MSDQTDQDSQSGQANPYDLWLKGVGVSADSFNQAGNAVATDPPTAQPWSFDPTDPGKRQPISLDLPLDSKYGTGQPDASPPVAQPTGGGGADPPDLGGGHEDPYVGQNKLVDPGDKQCGVSGTFDFDTAPRITGGYCDTPWSNGDPLDTTKGPPGSGGTAQPQFYPQPKGPVPPGKKWDPILGGWVGTSPSAIPQPPFPKPDPAQAPQPGDYNVPDSDTTVA